MTAATVEPERTCPSCGADTKPVRGHRALCADCSLDELKPGAWDKSKSVTRGVNEKAAKTLAGGKASEAKRS